MAAKVKKETSPFELAKNILQNLAEELRKKAEHALLKNEDQKLENYLKHKQILREIIRQITEMESFWTGMQKKRGRPRKNQEVEQLQVTKEPKKRGRKKKLTETETKTAESSVKEKKRQGRKKKTEKATPEKPKRQRIKKGLKTPEEFFVLPILESLIELDGYARASDVIEKIYQKVEHQLTEVDKEPLKSNQNETRWSNTAKLCRSKLVKEGYLSKKSPHGFWEITDKGRAYYQQLKTQQ